MQNLVTPFDLVPGLVIDFLGEPAIVTASQLDVLRGVNTLTLNASDGDFEVDLSWASSRMVNVLGVARDCEPDNITLFNS